MINLKDFFNTYNVLKGTFEEDFEWSYDILF